MTAKVYESAAEAVADIVDGATLAVGGFGLCGIPDVLIDAIAATSATDLEVFSNNCGVDDHGLGILLSAGRIRRVTASYVQSMYRTVTSDARSTNSTMEHCSSDGGQRSPMR
ncbi:MAG: hypothetical protein OXC29_05185 [Rhodococcus sp.]|nr:hypothetical protein [Rhodococcus sp. (in: high G+C Gram-positive bacteria)]